MLRRLSLDQVLLNIHLRRYWLLFGWSYIALKLLFLARILLLIACSLWLNLMWYIKATSSDLILLTINAIFQICQGIFSLRLLCRIFVLKGSFCFLVSFIIIKRVQFVHLLLVWIIVDLRGLLRDFEILPTKLDKVGVSTILQVFQVNCFFILVFARCVVIDCGLG